MAVLATVIGLVVLLATRGMITDLAAGACRGDSQAASRLRLIIGTVVAVVPLSVLGMTAYLFSIARRVRRAEEYPPPGMRFWRPVKRLRGAAARRVALVFAILAALLGVSGAGLLGLGLRMLQLLAGR